MSTINEGGPAFPAGSVRKSRPAHDPGGNWVETDRVQPLHQGLTMRDYFAAKAMQGDWAAQGADCGMFVPDSGDELFARAARMYYRMADAMLAARNSPTKS